MVEVLSEYFSDDMRKKATVRRVQTELNKTTLFEVLWAGKSVGVYQTEQEAENIAENYALGSQISRT
tara:strand:+ start:440 stop:640 length:201 start_codon:yes stop_codon:yes gene_type:complete